MKKKLFYIEIKKKTRRTIWTKKKIIREKYQRERDEILEKYEIEWKKRISDYAV